MDKITWHYGYTFKIFNLNCQFHLCCCRMAAMSNMYIRLKALEIITLRLILLVVTYFSDFKSTKFSYFEGIVMHYLYPKLEKLGFGQ